jgi:hypothetical protein
MWPLLNSASIDHSMHACAHPRNRFTRGLWSQCVWYVVSVTARPTPRGAWRREQHSVSTRATMCHPFSGRDARRGQFSRRVAHHIKYRSTARAASTAASETTSTMCSKVRSHNSRQIVTMMAATGWRASASARRRRGQKMLGGATFACALHLLSRGN